MCSCYYDIIPPHLFFTPTELAVWRNFTTWSTDGEEQVPLPRPTEWYPKGYETEKHGFHLDDDAIRAYQAWEMLRETTEPADFKWVLPSEDKLTVLLATKELEDLLSQLYTM